MPHAPKNWLPALLAAGIVVSALLLTAPVEAQGPPPPPPPPCPRAITGTGRAAAGRTIAASHRCVPPTWPGDTASAGPWDPLPARTHRHRPAVLTKTTPATACRHGRPWRFPPQAYASAAVATRLPRGPAPFRIDSGAAPPLLHASQVGGHGLLVDGQCRPLVGLGELGGMVGVVFVGSDQPLNISRRARAPIRAFLAAASAMAASAMSVTRSRIPMCRK